MVEQVGHGEGLFKVGGHKLTVEAISMSVTFSGRASCLSEADMETEDGLLTPGWAWNPTA